MPELKKRKYFYGYTIVAAGFLIQLLIMGTYRTYGLFFTPLSREFGWSSQLTSSAYSLAYLTQGLMAVVAGRLTDRFGPKIVLVASGVLAGTGYFLMSSIHSIWQVYLFFGLMVGAADSVDAPIFATLARWFVKKRGVMTGITKTGAGIGILVMPIAASQLILSYGWRQAYVVVGIICFIVIVGASLFMKHDPVQSGEYPDGMTKVDAVTSTVEARGFSLREVLRTRQFWTFGLVWFFLAFCIQVVMLDTAPQIINLGISPAVAGAVLGTIGGASIVGRLGIGGISDMLGYKATCLMSIALLTAGLIWVQFARQGWMFFIFTTLYGIAHGALFTLQSPMLAQLFGTKSLGATYGLLILIATTGGAIGPIISGRIFDITGSYDTAFLIILFLSVAALLLTATLKPTTGKTRATALTSS